MNEALVDAYLGRLEIRGGLGNAALHTVPQERSPNMMPHCEG